MTRRMLFVAFFFPPIGGVSVPRSLGHVRHLPAHGWETVVLTPRRSAYPLQDPGLLGSVPAGTRVIRTPIVEPAAVKGALRRLARPASPSPPGPRGDGAAVGGRLERLRRLLFFPDDQLGWIPFAVPAAIREHRRRPFNAIFSSSSPITAHLIAGLVQQRLGLPWVAEFRDPWIGNALAPRLPWLYRALMRRLERWIVSKADRCVFVTPTLAARYRQRYPEWAQRFETVTNAYDMRVHTADATDVAHGVDDRPLAAGSDDGPLLVYAGTLDRPRELATFLDGLQRQHEGSGGPRIRVEFVGHASDACRSLVEDASRNLGPQMVSHVGFVTRSEAQRRVAAADGALVLLADGPGMDLFIGGKLYEYLGADRPVFAMLPHGDARDLLTGLRWGTIAEPTPESVADALVRFAATRHEPAIADPERRYERGTVVAKLASVLNTAADGGSGP